MIDSYGEPYWGYAAPYLATLGVMLAGWLARWCRPTQAVRHLVEVGLVFLVWSLLLLLSGQLYTLLETQGVLPGMDNWFGPPS